MRGVELSIAYVADCLDAFQYAALQTGRLSSPDFELGFRTGRLDELDAAAAERRHQLSTISVLAWPRVAADYRVLAVGASVERGDGPLLVSRHYHHLAQLQFRRVAVPRIESLPGLLTRWACPDAELVEVDANRILPAVSQGQADAGVLTDERLPAASEVHAIVGLGSLWRSHTGLPLPLRLKIIDRRLDIDAAACVCELVRGSLRWSVDHPAETLRFAAAFPGEHTDEQLVRTVADDGLSLNDDARIALGLLYSIGHSYGLIRRLPEIEIVEAASTLVESSAR